MVAFPMHLRRRVDFCCDQTGDPSGFGCGHHIDGHGYGSGCQVPGCECPNWHDHTFCDHRQQDIADAESPAEVERFRETLTDFLADAESIPEDHPAYDYVSATAGRLRLILAGERP